MSIQIQSNSNLYTSGSYDFILTRNEIIELAYENIGIKQANQELTPEQYNRASKILNAMVKSWAAEEIMIWNLDWFNLNLHSSDIRNVAGVDYECIRNNESSLANKPGVGFEFPSFWKALETNTAVPWAPDNVFVANGDYFINNEIIGIDVARLKEDQGFRILHSMSESDYFALGNPLTQGTPARYYFRKQLTSELFLYPVPDVPANYQVELSAYRYPQDFDTGSDEPDFLQEWIEPLYMALSVRLASQNGIFGNRLNELKTMAEEAKERARMADHEYGSFFFKPDLRGKDGLRNG